MPSPKYTTINQIPVLDQYDDNGLFLRKELGGTQPPTIIKTAANLSDVAVKHDEDYALVASTPYGKEHRYPCTDAGNTITSSMYFSEYGHQLPQDLQVKVASKLNEALINFGFEPTQEITKTASIELGYSDHADNMSLDVLFGVDQDTQYEKLTDAFDGFSPRGKRRLMLQVKEASVSVPDSMSVYGNDHMGSDLQMSIDLRKMVVLDEVESNALDFIMEKAASVDVDTLASAIYEFDIKNGITGLYGRMIPDPYISVLGNSIEKVAMEKVSSVVEIGGREYGSSDISGYLESSGDKISEAFGDEMRDQLSQDPVNVLKSLPTTHQQAIARMIDNG